MTSTSLTARLPSFVTHLECSMTGERYDADVLQGLSRVGRPPLVRYDLDGVRAAMTKDVLAARPANLWKYRELLPVRDAADIVSLGEQETPLVTLDRVGAKRSARAPRRRPARGHRGAAPRQTPRA